MPDVPRQSAHIKKNAGVPRSKVMTYLAGQTKVITYFVSIKKKLFLYEYKL